MVKLLAAEWYLGTLRELVPHTEDLDRYLGVEIALDGYLGAVSSMFDAAVAALLEALERGSANPTPAHLYTWEKCKTVARLAQIHLRSEPLIEEALKPAGKGKPKGWLVELRHRRNRSTHHSTLTRQFNRTIGAPQIGPLTQFAETAEQPGDIIDYCHDRLVRATVLVGLVCADLDDRLRHLA